MDNTATTATTTGAAAQDQLGVHEILEMHEILNFRTVCATKSTTMQALVTDDKLRDLLQQDVAVNKQAIQGLQSVLSRV
ncbi:hypothetical protein [Paenibacillus xerothermodurans]|uniref:Spore coat protein n=1 Tax=Paenibacillus xerothermodurans TaxID=1977292 RepID=A0A2W1NQX5_PAEXE|nr:hypothetical protein [Paenibacillus xerothermodurans]PZE21273.1 hypothetical protein CBW46_007835 [Paenibacillus xerothermodurans]